MKNDLNYMLFRSLSILLVAVSLSEADEGALPERWWSRSSLLQQDQSGNLQGHVEFGMGGQEMDGNESGFAVNGRGLAVLRKRPFSYYLDGNIDKQDKDYGVLGSLDQTEYMLRNTVRYDIWREVFTSLGYIREQDDPRFVDLREGIFWGVGTRVDLSKTVYVTAYGAYGRDTADYNSAAASDFGVTDDSEDSMGVLLTQSCRWQATPTLGLEENGMYVTYEEASMEDRWQVGASADIALIQYVSLVLEYEVVKESNPLLQAVGGDEINNNLTFIVRINY